MGAITESRTRRLQQSLSAQTLRGTEPRASTLCVITGLRPAAVAVHEGIGTRDDGFEMPAVSSEGATSRMVIGQPGLGRPGDRVCEQKRPCVNAGTSLSWRCSMRREPCPQAKARVACRSWGQILGTHHEGRTLSSEATKKAICWPFVSPLTDSNRRPPPYHGGFGAVLGCTIGHRRSRLTCKSARCGMSRVSSRTRVWST
jgi:hypothetical protein